MASATLDVVLAMESKLRTNVKSDALRWNATAQQFERFDGSAWAACVDVPSDVVHKAGAETITGAKTFSGGLSGSLTGDVTGNCSGSSGSCTGNAATATTASSCSGNAATATALATARTIQTNLASSASASFDGSANVTPGVTGVLPVANGGTGATSLSSITVGEATKATQDGSGNVITSTYLPLSGGTMTGDICIGGTARIIGVATKGINYLGGPTYGSCGELTLLDGAHQTYPGHFFLRGRDESTTGELHGTPAGSLKWQNMEVERVNSSGTNYIRYENGLQICWGSSVKSTTSQTVTFPAAFTLAPWTVGNYGDSGTTGILALSTETTTSFTWSTTATGGVRLNWIAVGWWQ